MVKVCFNFPRYALFLRKQKTDQTPVSGAACNVIRRFPAGRAQSAGVKYLGGHGLYYKRLDQLMTPTPPVPTHTDWDLDDDDNVFRRWWDRTKGR
jgi:hypothetical protein